LLALAGLAVVVLIVAFAFLLGGDSHSYKLVFENAGQLVKGDDVQVGGRRIGSVESIKLTDDNQAAIDVKINGSFGPLHQGTIAGIRATSLSGIANRYIALTPGPNSARELPDGALLGAEKTTAPVDLDQLFDTFDDRTRKSLQQVVQGFATQYDGRGAQANDAARYFNPALSAGDRVFSELARDEDTFTDFVVKSSRVVTALAARRGDISNLVSNANRTTGAIAQESASLEQALAVLPATLRRGNTTFADLRATLGDLDELVAVSKPATKNLTPFLRQLRPLVAGARPTLRDLSRLVRRPGGANDLTDATLRVPHLQTVASPVLARSRTALQKTQPVLDFARPYTPELMGWIRDFGQGASNYDANGHFARIQPLVNLFSLAGNVLNPVPTQSRLAGLQTGYVKRCPGTATQVPEDGSAPFTDGGLLGAEDCDPSLRLPG
jgi:phospholipid/cholesterol/gamma-HCH transport system substrate-binding protein